MGLWKYEGQDKNGKKVFGQVNAKNEKEVRKRLRAQGIRTKKITAPSILEFDIGEWLVDSGFAAPFGPTELGIFTKQLAIMINAGVPIIQSLEILYKSEKNNSLKKAIKEIANDVGEGKTIADAMEKQKGFDNLYCSLVRAGEAGGILDGILNKLSEHMEKQEKTKAQIKSAMTYPFIVCIVGAAVIWGMLVFVVPNFVDMLEQSGQEPPAITQFVMNSAKFMGEWTPYLVPGVLVLFVILRSYVNTASGKIIYDAITMKLPLFGTIVIKGNLSSFARTLSTMVGSGVALVDSLDICIATIGNKIIAKDIRKVRNAVVEGKTLYDPLAKIVYFPEMVSQMIKVGEQTGSLDTMLGKISEVFEDEVNSSVENMTKLIEPIIIVVLGSIVAVILVAMYLPIFMSAGGAG